jgi:hypothetical protein
MISTKLMIAEAEISAMCLNEQQPSIINLGLANGYLVDFSLKTKGQTRSANVHDGKRVLDLTSRKKYLASLCEAGVVIVYDYSTM